MDVKNKTNDNYSMHLLYLFTSPTLKNKVKIVLYLKKQILNLFIKFDIFYDLSDNNS